MAPLRSLLIYLSWGTVFWRLQPIFALRSRLPQSSGHKLRPVTETQVAWKWHRYGFSVLSLRRNSFFGKLHFAIYLVVSFRLLALVFNQISPSPRSWIHVSVIGSRGLAPSPCVIFEIDQVFLRAFFLSRFCVYNFPARPVEYRI